MLKIRTLEIAGFSAAVQALRLPFKKECRSDAGFTIMVDEDGLVETPSIIYSAKVDFDDKDLHLMSTLIKRGDEHSKVIRGINVFAEIDAPLYWWSEADTYRVGTERLSSASTMHTLGKCQLNIDDFAVGDDIKQMLTPTRGYVPSELRVDAPSELKSKVFTYNGRKYEVWNNGEIYSLPFEITCLNHGKECVRKFEKKLVKPSLKPDGYYSVRLGGKSGGNMQHHKVLALCFVENSDPENKTQVNHIDGNRSNNTISNLEWTSPLENTRHAISIGNKPVTQRFRYLTHKNSIKYTGDVMADIAELRKQGYTLKEIADIYDTCETTISQVCQKYNMPYKSSFELAEYYENTISTLNSLAEEYVESQSVDTLIAMKNILPSSFMQKRVQMFSYQTLRRIYVQRRNHRLPMWKAFCKWIESLPFAKELILVGIDNEGI